MEIKTPIIPCTSKDCPSPAARPTNSILENRQLKIEGINIMTQWQRDLDIFIEDYGDALLAEVGDKA
jgi:dTDP-4-dehydrorhamnose reductase